jgi:hypothetical protein
MRVARANKRRHSVVQVLDRLSPRDIYRQLDWLRDEWSGDEVEVARKLVRLRRMFEHLPARYYERATGPLEELAHARLVSGGDYSTPLRQLAELASEWDRSRPPLLTCECCGLTVRGHQILKQHLWAIHDRGGDA